MPWIAPFARRLLRFAACAAALFSAPAGATVLLLGQGADVNLDAAGPNDLQGLLCNCPAATSVRHLNGSQRWSSNNSNWNTIGVCDAGGSAQTGDFVPGDDELYIVRTGSGTFFKFRHPNGSTNNGTGISIEYVSLGSTPCTPPAASFTWVSHDLITQFTNTSTNATTYAWAFGDGGNSSQQSPTHAYATSNTWNACLTATGTGGTSAPTCHGVTVSQVPSTQVPVNGFLDFDPNASNDIQVQATGACGATPNKIHMLNAARWGVVTAPYDAVNLAMAQAATLSTSDVCHAPQEFGETFIVKTAIATWVKAWTPQNDGGGIRFQYQVLQAGSSTIFSDGFASGNTGSWSVTAGVGEPAPTRLRVEVAVESEGRDPRPEAAPATLARLRDETGHEYARLELLRDAAGLAVRLVADTLRASGQATPWLALAESTATVRLIWRANPDEPGGSAFLALEAVDGGAVGLAVPAAERLWIEGPVVEVD